MNLSYIVFTICFGIGNFSGAATSYIFTCVDSSKFVLVIFFLNNYFLKAISSWNSYYRLLWQIHSSKVLGKSSLFQSSLILQTRYLWLGCKCFSSFKLVPHLIIDISDDSAVEDTIRGNLAKLVDARFVERCPTAEPFLTPPSEEETVGRKRGAKSSKVLN